MTYQIYYIPKDMEDNGRGSTMFDIEYYLTQSPREKDKWYTEVKSLPIVGGIVHFLHDHSQDPSFNWMLFSTDATEIEELRGLLYESYDNSPKNDSEARHFHYHVFGEVIKEKIYHFAEKYGLFVNVD